ncbi:MAG: hypothetical protein ACP5F3_05910, partial [Candidatus Syntrophosphaera sp.]
MKDRELFADLEFAALVREISARCHSPLGAAHAEKLRPLGEMEAIGESLRIVSQVQECLERGLDLELSELSDISPLFDSAEHALFAFEEFLIVDSNARLALIVSAKEDSIGVFPDLSRIWRKVAPLPEICRRFEEVFDPDGEVMDSASPELARIRKRIASLQRNIMKTMRGMLEDNRFKSFLQDDFITRRDDRYVLPIKENAGAHVPGIVQGQSGSRSTLFIEPQSVVPLNNELQILKQEEKREIHRIFTEFTRQIKLQKEPLLQNQAALAELDLRFACGRLCRALGASAPRIVDEP